MKQFINISIVALMSILVSSCDKAFLEKKNDQKLLVPATFEDFRNLLDNYSVMNTTGGLCFIASDDYSITDAGYTSLGAIEKLAYTWEFGQMESINSSNWETLYKTVFYSNIVLDGLDKVEESSKTTQQYNELKGSALFYRAMAFSRLMVDYAPAYEKAKENIEVSIPMPLTSDVTVAHKTTTLGKFYDKILTDLKAAGQLLPENQAYKTRPSGIAALSLQARIYLDMQDYINAEKYAQMAVDTLPALLDYSTLDTNSTRPFPSIYPSGPGSPEIIFYAPTISYPFLSYSNQQVIVNKTLYESYSTDDLRYKLFFNNRGNGVVNFKGSYGGSKRTDMFAGLSTDENYLILAEALARNNKPQQALEYLNDLLVTRYKKGKFIPYTTENVDDILNCILKERQKELISRGTRWADLKRFSREEGKEVVLKRTVNGVDYSLHLSSDMYIMPKPISEQ